MPEWRVPLARLQVERADVEAVVAALESGWLTMGPRTERFERELAAYAGVEHALACSSGTAALHLACLAAGLGPGDEAIVPSLTFAATAAAVAHTGAAPVFCDVASSLAPLASAERAAELVGPRTRAVVVMHYAGFVCDMAAWRALCSRHGLALIEDAAHAIGTRDGGVSAGALGDLGAFSLFSNKNLAAGEGGALLTPDGERAERVRLLRSHGMTTGTWARHEGAGEYELALLGHNYRIDELRAALACSRLARLDAEAALRREAVARYRALLGGARDLELPFADRALDGVAPHLMPVLVPAGARGRVRERLAAAGIQTSRHYPPLHGFRPFAGARRGPLDATERYAERTLTLPLWPGMPAEDVELVAAELRAAVAAG